MESAVLDMLQPHTKLKELTIKSYAGKEFSSWVAVFLFSNVVLVRLEECNNCLSLPPLGQLPHLKELYIRGMNAVESVGAEFYGECISPFPLLETLEFVDMQHWKEWLPFQLDHGNGVFPCLKTLFVKKCSKLGGKLPENLNSLAKLGIVKCEELVVSIANYKQLRQLNIDCCKVLVHTAAKVEFELLESLCLSNISELMSLQTGELFQKGLSKFRDLKINGYNSPLVEELGKEADELLQLQILECKLEGLEPKRCKNILKLPKGLNQLLSLQQLCIHKCLRLVSFEDVGLPPSLKDIKITECHSMIYLAKFQIPQNLGRIQISDCKSLKSLVDEEVVGSSLLSSHICLEYLKIQECQSLTLLSLSGQLLRTLKHLEIYDCLQLELIVQDGFSHYNTNQCLEYIRIWKCQNLKYLPDGLCHLINLQTLDIYYWGSLVSIPGLSGGRRAFNLREIKITDCDKLEVLPEAMHNLNSLEELTINYREDSPLLENYGSTVMTRIRFRFHPTWSRRSRSSPNLLLDY
ncbi:putative disease resistance protein At3g14460 [Malus sylvestris]|uniref:putative disease resistance protein At3g14460 n=1 Tax=Malus sylvestris TaxID=3752 RepID=UPI0021AD391F|nr:putative disease resistance protein At3g14460 [Malus sylvestris]